MLIKLKKNFYRIGNDLEENGSAGDRTKHGHGSAQNITEANAWAVKEKKTIFFCDEVNQILRKMYEDVMKNVLKKTCIYETNGGGHLCDFIFHA